MPSVLGNVKSLKKSMLTRLERLYRRRVSADVLFSYDLAEELCQFSLEIRRELTVLIDGRGRVVTVLVGVGSDWDRIADLEPPAPESGVSDFIGFRTQLGWNEPTVNDQVTVLQYHLPVMGVLIAGVDEGFSRSRGENPHFCDAAFLVRPVADEPVKCDVEPPMPPRQLESEDRDTWQQWGSEAFVDSSTRQVAGEERAVLIGIGDDGGDDTARGTQLGVLDSLAELRLLAETAGASVVGELHQRRRRPDPRTYIGAGKAEALALEIQQKQANVVIADDELTPAQQRSLERILRVKVIDRTEVILDIFAQRAQSREGKIQVSLAQLKYLLPRLVGRGRMFSQQTSVGAKAGIATRGPGETKLETDRRALNRRINQLEREAKAVVKHRDRQRQQRQKEEVPLVALVGYTNAGKSTLMKRLTQADVLVEDKLFATLDPTIRRLYLPSGQEVLLSDTVGFIQKLPTFLIKAFRATLEEVVEADVILHVWDVSHPNRLAHWHAVSETMAEVGVEDTPVVTVCNKIDRLKEAERELEAVQPMLGEWVAISAVTGEGLDDLLGLLASLFPELEINS